MKNIKIVLVILVSSIFYVSCNTTIIQDLQPKVALPTYSANVAPVINANCVSCHSDAGNQTSPYLDTYDALKLACQTSVNGNGTVLCRIDGSCGSYMPQSGAMPQANIDMIKTWAANGYAQ